MYWIVFIVMIANIISVVFASKGSKLTWAFSLVGSLLMCWMLFKDHLYMTFAFNAYGAGAAIVGLVTWKTREDTKRKICYSETWKTMLIVMALGILIMILDKEISATMPLFDSLGTALTTVATFLMVKKDINAWICFILADLFYVVMGAVSGTLLNGIDGVKWMLIYGAMLVTATYGLMTFIKIYNANQEAHKKHAEEQNNL